MKSECENDGDFHYGSTTVDLIDNRYILIWPFGTLKSQPVHYRPGSGRSSSGDVQRGEEIVLRRCVGDHSRTRRTRRTKHPRWFALITSPFGSVVTLTSASNNVSQYVSCPLTRVTWTHSFHFDLGPLSADGSLHAYTPPVYHVA